MRNFSKLSVLFGAIYFLFLLGMTVYAQQPQAPAGEPEGSTQSPSTISSGERIVNQVAAAVSGAAVTGGTAGTLSKFNVDGVSLVNSVAVESVGKIGIGTSTPLSKLDVNGCVAIGSYAGTTAAPANGLIVSGPLGIGTSNPANTFSVGGGTVLGVVSTSNIINLHTPHLATALSITPLREPLGLHFWADSPRTGAGRLQRNPKAEGANYLSP